MLLTIPTLDPAIPTTITLGRCGEAHLKMIRAMLAHGMISKTEIEHLTPASVDSAVLRRLIERGWTRKLAHGNDFQILGIRLFLDFTPADRYTEDVWSLQFLGQGRDMSRLAIGPQATALEALFAGAGQFVLAYVDAALSHFAHFPYTPGGAFSLASMLYWYGEDDEGAAMTQLIEEGADEDELDLPTRDYLFGQMPDWAYGQAHTPVLPIADFQERIKAFEGTPFEAVLSGAARLAVRLAEAPLRLEPCEGDIDDALVLLTWEPETDPIIRVLDDYCNGIMQGGGEVAECLASIPIPLDLPQEFPESLDALDQALQVLHLLDDLLAALMETPL